MKFTLPISSALLFITAAVTMFTTTSAAFCNYDRSDNLIQCGSVTCRTVDHINKPPLGYYNVGQRNNVLDRHLKSHQLYLRNSFGGFWAADSLVPEFPRQPLGCGPGGFGFLLTSQIFTYPGWINVIDPRCYIRLQEQIEIPKGIHTFETQKCLGCINGNTKDCNGIQTAPFGIAITDLIVTE